jgi:hypothetical protein
MSTLPGLLPLAGPGAFDARGKNDFHPALNRIQKTKL